MKYRLDLRADVGVPGWIREDGAHVTLSEVVSVVGERAQEEHRGACVLLALSLSKLLWEMETV